jgi:hypothetical protein
MRKPLLLALFFAIIFPLFAQKLFLLPFADKYSPTALEQPSLSSLVYERAWQTPFGAALCLSEQGLVCAVLPKTALSKSIQNSAVGFLDQALPYADERFFLKQTLEISDASEAVWGEVKPEMPLNQALYFADLNASAYLNRREIPSNQLHTIHRLPHSSEFVYERWKAYREVNYLGRLDLEQVGAANNCLVFFRLPEAVELSQNLNFNTNANLISALASYPSRSGFKQVFESFKLDQSLAKQSAKLVASLAKYPELQALFFQSSLSEEEQNQLYQTQLLAHTNLLGQIKTQPELWETFDDAQQKLKALGPKMLALQSTMQAAEVLLFENGALGSTSPTEGSAQAEALLPAQLDFYFQNTTGAWLCPALARQYLYAGKNPGELAKIILGKNLNKELGDSLRFFLDEKISPNWAKLYQEAQNLGQQLQRLSAKVEAGKIPALDANNTLRLQALSGEVLLEKGKNRRFRTWNLSGQLGGLLLNKNQEICGLLSQIEGEGSGDLFDSRQTLAQFISLQEVLGLLQNSAQGKLLAEECR